MIRAIILLLWCRYHLFHKPSASTEDAVAGLWKPCIKDIINLFQILAGPLALCSKVHAANLGFRAMMILGLPAARDWGSPTQLPLDILVQLWRLTPSVGRIEVSRRWGAAVRAYIRATSWASRIERVVYLIRISIAWDPLLIRMASFPFWMSAKWNRRQQVFILMLILAARIMIPNVQGYAHFIHGPITWLPIQLSGLIYSSL